MSEKTKWKGIVFDFDGTLIDSQREGLKRFLRIADLLGLAVSEEILLQIKKMWGVPGHVLVQASWPETSVSKFMDTWEMFDSKNPLFLFPGTREIIERLSLQFRLSLLTSRDKSTHFQLQCNNLEELFSFVCTLRDSPMPKPHPRSIEPLLDQYKRHGITLKDLVLVGDSVHSDYGLAQALDMDFIAVTWGVNPRNDFVAAGINEQYVIDTIEDLPRLLFL